MTERQKFEQIEKGAVDLIDEDYEDVVDVDALSGQEPAVTEIK